MTDLQKHVSAVYIFAAIIVILGMIGVLASGCSMLSRQGPQPVITEPPTPGVQLWQAVKKSNWLVTISILGIAGGVFALANGSAKLGSAVIASGSTSLFMTLAVSRFAMWMAVFGLLGSLAAVLFSILARRKALVEIIKGVQDYKDNLRCKSPLLAGALNEQSNTTKKIVSNIKNELRLKGEL